MTVEEFLVAFIPQLLATIAGGGIGVFGVWLAFRWQQGASARDATDRAVENLLVRIADYVADLEAYRGDFEMVNWGAGGRPQRQMPHAAVVSIAVELVRMRTKGSELAIADEIGRAWSLIAGAGLDKRGTACAFLAEAITMWRSGATPEAVADRLETARQLSLKDDEVEISSDDD